MQKQVVEVNLKKVIVVIVAIILSAIVAGISSVWLGFSNNKLLGHIIFGIAFLSMLTMNLPKKIGMGIAFIDAMVLCLSASLIITLNIEMISNMDIVLCILLFIAGSIIQVRYFNDFYNENVRNDIKTLR